MFEHIAAGAFFFSAVSFAIWGHVWRGRYIALNAQVARLLVEQPYLLDASERRASQGMTP